MPTTSWQTAIRDISRELGFFQFASTTNLTTNTSVISTDLSAVFDQDDFFIGWFIIIRGSNNDEVVRRITDYAASTGTLTVAGANLAAESGAQTCELHRFNPERIRDHYNRARQDVYPQLCLVRNHETIVTGQWHHRYTLPSTLRGRPIQLLIGNRREVSQLALNLAADGGFEDWTSSTALNHFSLSGTSASVNQEVQTTSPANYMVLAGTNSARLFTASSGLTTLLETVTPSQASQGVELNVAVWVYTRTSGRISASADGTLGSTHDGTGWERLTASKNLGETATTFDWGVSVTAGGQFNAYVDEGIPVLGQEEAYDHDWVPVLNWEWVPPVAGASNNGLLEFPSPLPEQRILRVITRDLLSSVSADSDTFEIDGELLVPLYDRVRQLLADDAANSSMGGSREFWHTRALEFGAKVELAFNRGSTVSLPRPQPRIPDWGYR